MARKKRLIMGISSIFLCIIVYFFYITMPRKTQTNYYQFSCPKNISVKTTDFPNYSESVFMDREKIIGGVNYYSSIDRSDFFTQQAGNPDFDLESFLKKNSFIDPNESLDAYMMDANLKNQTIELWEMRGNIERNHYLFFTKTSSCFDLWFFCDKLEDSAMQNIEKSFQLEV